MSTTTPLIGRAESRYGMVLILLLVTFVVLMIGSTAPWLRVLTVALTGATLVAALVAADNSPRVCRGAALIGAVGLIVALVLVGHGRSGEGAVAVVGGALVAAAPVAIARSVLRRGVVDRRTVMAALSVYVLLAMFWAFVYTAVGRFGSAPFFSQLDRATSADFLYFSFITQTTVGYGDLSAAGNTGRACAVLEALLGQLYLVTIVAVVVSRLRPRNAPRER
jgi:hypothetical protein